MSSDTAERRTPDRALTAMGERVAVVETKVGAIQTDLARIGTHIHQISNVVTEIGYVEKKCLEGLTAVGATVDRFEAKLEALIQDRSARQGVADFGRKFAMIITAGGALAAILTAAGALLIFLAHYLKGP